MITNVEKFFEACKSGDLITVKQLLLLYREEVSVNSKTDDGYTGLMYASLNGHLELVKFLLTSPEIPEHSNINDSNRFLDSALSFACYHNHFDIVKFLLNGDELKQKADIHLNNDHAIRESIIGIGENFDIVKYLLTSCELDEHADPYQVDYAGRNTFELAADANLYDFIGFLLFEFNFVMTEKNAQLLEDEPYLSEFIIKYKTRLFKEQLEHTLDEKNSCSSRIKL